MWVIVSGYGSGEWDSNSLNCFRFLALFAFVDHNGIYLSPKTLANNEILVRNLAYKFY